MAMRQSIAVQSIAGGIASTLSIGVSAGTQEGFRAPAWLEVGDELVTGGDIASFVPLRMTADRRRA